MKEPIVLVTEGKLLGTVKVNYVGEKFYSFQGVPYAKPPLNNLRFKAPQPPEKWEGIRNATEDGNQCYAKNFINIDVYAGSEDCLYLNIFTKDLSENGLKPVMVWIHGGAFTTGSNNTIVYGPEFLMMEDIVLVTLNYRLGPLGFMFLDDPSLGVPGNAGMKDIVMSLKWVQLNIRQFGGNPNNVTIFGESAGGAAVHLLMLSPMSKGLFHKAIAQSGCALNDWVHCKRHGPYLLAEELGIHSKNEKVILKHLQEIPVEDLVKGLDHDHFRIGELRPFTPTIEKVSNEPAFLTEDPLYLINTGKYHKVPFIMGCCSREGMFVYALLSTGRRNHLLRDETIIPFSLNLRKGSNKYDMVKKEILEFYFNNKEPSLNIDNVYRLYTDNYFLFEVYRTAKCHIETNTQPIYFYNFELDTNLNLLKNLYGITDKGASHVDDLGYLFKNNLSDDYEAGTPEGVGIRRLVKLWTNFAKYGTPTPNKQDVLLGDLEWKPITRSKFNVLNISSDLKLLPRHPEEDSLQFWESLYKKLQIRLSKL